MYYMEIFNLMNNSMKSLKYPGHFNNIICQYTLSSYQRIVRGLGHFSCNVTAVIS